MSNTEYIRTAANKYGWKKYYSLIRPVSLGTAPKVGMMDFINYDSKTEIRANIGIMRAWAELYYNRELTEVIQRLPHHIVKNVLKDYK